MYSHSGIIGFILLTGSFRPHYGRGIDSTSNRSEYQGYFLGGEGGRCVGLTYLTTFMHPTPTNSGILNLLEP